MVLIIFAWFSAFVFLIVAGYRIMKIGQLPQNLRWEVYPIPHEAKSKRAYGGSYMEEVDWTQIPHPPALLQEYLEMGSEIFGLKRVRQNNPYHLWEFSLAMHWGIYLYFGWIFLLIAENLINFSAISYVTNVVGVVAFILGILGSLGLLVRRRSNQNLDLYTTPIDYFNLLFLAAIFLAGFVSWLPAMSFADHKAYFGSVLFFKPTTVPTLVAAAFILFEFFMIYMPFTKLNHYFVKYFTFHQALWDDAFSAKGSPTEARVVRQLGYAANWRGPHIITGKTWLEQAQATGESEKK